MGKRCAFSFAISAISGLVVNMLIEMIVRQVTGVKDFIPISLEYMELFPTVTLALEVHILLYGLIGMTFAAMMFIFECHSIGFLIQNILYFLATSVVWIPIVTFVWQLQKYPSALIGTLTGFGVTYGIISAIAYYSIKKDVKQINEMLMQKE